MKCLWIRPEASEIPVSPVPNGCRNCSFLLLSLMTCCQKEINSARTMDVLLQEAKLKLSALTDERDELEGKLSMLKRKKSVTRKEAATTEIPKLHEIGARRLELESLEKLQETVMAKGKKCESILAEIHAKWLQQSCVTNPTSPSATADISKRASDYLTERMRALNVNGVGSPGASGGLSQKVDSKSHLTRDQLVKLDEISEHLYSLKLLNSSKRFSFSAGPSRNRPPLKVDEISLSLLDGLKKDLLSWESLSSAKAKSMPAPSSESKVLVQQLAKEKVISKGQGVLLEEKSASDNEKDAVAKNLKAPSAQAVVASPLESSTLSGISSIGSSKIGPPLKDTFVAPTVSSPQSKVIPASASQDRVPHSSVKDLINILQESAVSTSEKPKEPLRLKFGNLESVKGSVVGKRDNLDKPVVLEASVSVRKPNLELKNEPFINPFAEIPPQPLKSSMDLKRDIGGIKEAVSPDKKRLSDIENPFDNPFAGKVPLIINLSHLNLLIIESEIEDVSRFQEFYVYRDYFDAAASFSIVKGDTVSVDLEQSESDPLRWYGFKLGTFEFGWFPRYCVEEGGQFCLLSKSY